MRDDFVSDDVLEERRKNIKLKDISIKSGYLAKYAKSVSSANKGALT